FQPTRIGDSLHLALERTCTSPSGHPRDDDSSFITLGLVSPGDAFAGIFGPAARSRRAPDAAIGITPMSVSRPWLCRHWHQSVRMWSARSFKHQAGLAL